MSRVLVIPDVHLKPWIFAMADKIDKSSYDDIVILAEPLGELVVGSDCEIKKLDAKPAA